jgi:hypothetical protein
MQKEQAELLVLALRRYPDLEPRMALHCFESDRSTARLGALKPSMFREDRPGQEIFRSKDFDPMRYRVLWTLSVQREARWESPEPEIVPFWEVSEAMTVTVVAVPAGNETLCVQMDVPELQTQCGRRFAAARLRDARRQLREMTR